MKIDFFKTLLFDLSDLIFKILNNFWKHAGFHVHLKFLNFCKFWVQHIFEVFGLCSCWDWNFQLFSFYRIPGLWRDCAAYFPCDCCPWPWSSLDRVPAGSTPRREYVHLLVVSSPSWIFLAMIKFSILQIEFDGLGSWIYFFYFWWLVVESWLEVLAYLLVWSPLLWSSGYMVVPSFLEVLVF